MKNYKLNLTKLKTMKADSISVNNIIDITNWKEAKCIQYDIKDLIKNKDWEEELVKLIIYTTDNIKITWKYDDAEFLEPAEFIKEYIVVNEGE